eukprot:TRINITY_DN7277_c0_g1_i1.p1 TRINITY_DN7277_c0_g1~~TRINITY_DN7277_c0_g1_i1.p1  ORF type:complete len:514 (-),score=124.99 TRINITY_DN7277_c0_g1_i1:9-1427(-)
MFDHGFESYMEVAFPADEVSPLTCQGQSGYGGIAITLLDSLDTCALISPEKFEAAVRAAAAVDFAVDAVVSPFEVNIRGVGGLLSGHLLAEELLDNYDGSLLRAAVELATRLLPAFDTKTGIARRRVNLLQGAAFYRTQQAVELNLQQSTAAEGASFLLEFGLLSRLTNDPKWLQLASRASDAVWAHRSPVNGLVGVDINVDTGEWMTEYAGMGSGTDSFYEYLLKGALLFGNNTLHQQWNLAYRNINAHLANGTFFYSVPLSPKPGDAPPEPFFFSLQAFFPAMHTLSDNLASAETAVRVYSAIWQHFRGLPAVFDVQTTDIYPGGGHYPLRPELAESLFYVFAATKNPLYPLLASDILGDLDAIARQECGFASYEIPAGRPLSKHRKRKGRAFEVADYGISDHMESFFLAETLKYLHLIFDAALDDSAEHTEGRKQRSGANLLENYVLSTEAHLFPKQLVALRHPPRDEL